jgi:dTDP-4-dehydrorhamnose 3,5-epimerase
MESFFHTGARGGTVHTMRITPIPEFPDILVIDPDIYPDSRGFFFELHHEVRYRAAIPERFVQDNISRSGHGVIRGLHYQTGTPQGKLVTVLEGEILDVAVDIRRGSPTFGTHADIILSGKTCRQLYIPPGFAHGFCVTGPHALVLYKCTELYNPADERGIRWDDPALAIRWPSGAPILSDRDKGLPTLDSIGQDSLPSFSG